MPHIVTMDRGRTLCHRPTLSVVTCTCRLIAWATAVHRLQIEEVIGGMALLCTTLLRTPTVALMSGAPVNRCGVHAAMNASVRHDP